MGQIGTKQRLYDSALVLEDGTAGAKSSSPFSYSTILDVGTGRIEGDCVLDIAALDITSNDELYRFVVQGSDSATFAGVEEELGTLVIGAKEVTESDNDSLPGRYFIPFDNVKGSSVYRYIRLRCVAQGTTFSYNVGLAYLTPRK